MAIDIPADLKGARDIKPENILFSQGHPIVADFGIAKAISTAGGVNLTRTGFPLGTPAT